VERKRRGARPARRTPGLILFQAELSPLAGLIPPAITQVWPEFRHNARRFPARGYNSAMTRSPDITVAAVTETDGRFLVVEERINRRLVFNQPAGHVERGETILMAVVREVREETAWRFEPVELLGVYLWRNPSSGRYTMRFAFTGSVSDHDAAQPLDRGIVRTHWLSHMDLREREPRLRSPLVLRCVEDYLEGRRHPLEAVATLDLHSAPTTSVPAITV
jgi:8-oxo-dGTP pyrophosphatase MutT (NUDIX family)